MWGKLYNNLRSVEDLIVFMADWLPRGLSLLMDKIKVEIFKLSKITFLSSVSFFLEIKKEESLRTYSKERDIKFLTKFLDQNG